MTEPKRWSNTGSDVDPVLRSVLRYARDLAPSRSETQSLLQRLDCERTTFSRRGFTARLPHLNLRAAVWMSAALSLGVAGVAWGGYTTWRARTTELRASLGAEPSQRPESPRSSNELGVRAGPQGQSSNVVPSLSAMVSSSPPRPPLDIAPLSNASAMASSGRSIASAPPSRRVAVSKDGDAELLQDARTAMTASPSRALTLTLQHAARFAGSSLTEERSALQIEALSRLGRAAEAEQAHQVFVSRYPLSPYRRRLQSLVQSSSSR